MQLSYSISEVCKATSLGRTKIYQHLKRGELKSRKLGKRTIILKTDLDDFLNNLPLSRKVEVI